MPDIIAAYAKLSIEELINKYQLAVLTLSNLHEDLHQATSDHYSDYLEHWQSSTGKSVAERNRDSDNATKLRYQEIISIRGRINRLSEQRDMFVNLINWKMRLRSSSKPDLTETYPPDKDKTDIGNG